MRECTYVGVNLCDVCNVCNVCVCVLCVHLSGAQK